MRNTKNIDRTAWEWRNITLDALDNMRPPGEIDYYVWTDELNLRISEALAKESHPEERRAESDGTGR